MKNTAEYTNWFDPEGPLYRRYIESLFEELQALNGLFSSSRIDYTAKKAFARRARATLKEMDICYDIIKERSRWIPREQFPDLEIPGLKDKLEEIRKARPKPSRKMKGLKKLPKI